MLSSIAPFVGARRLTLIVGASLSIGACDSSSGGFATANRVDRLVLHGQVALIQAQNSARAAANSRATEEAAATVEMMRAQGEDPDRDQFSPQKKVALGERYEVRRDGAGWTVYDTQSGKAAVISSGELRGLPEDVAQNRLEFLNRGQSAAGRGPVKLGGDTP